ncbi:polysaccharide biosynthesis/export family protein [Plebeiibacterium marinum]|uniref:Polysaccharide export protein n=1 Tax=Plebeiibacterium marinum TaxID=2992111 RepID=A0AAE3MF16_9BACT|nr:polysaccharide biosynthesis/export family protein [Plebeiobacterium marinum]MCW3806324.1 polysaccharide export protein [Plebeiobacterium marinum]
MKNFFPRSIIKVFSLLIIAGLASSCVNLKKVELIQKKSHSDYSQEIVNAQTNAYKINSGDHLYIKIYSSDAETSRYFQTDFPELMNSSYIYLNSYKVDSEGYVSYSFTGKTLVKGLSIEEAQSAITETLGQFFKDVKVQVKLVNFNISILGEVNNPGTYNIDRDQVTILQALGMAGGITDFGKATQVTLVRKSANGNKVSHIDLTDNGLLSSEYFFLLPDDVIYVAPRGSKSFVFEKMPYGMVFGILSLVVSIIAVTD